MKAAFFDVDGTLTKVRIWEGIMAYFKVHGGKRGTYMLFWGYHAPLFILYRIKLLPQIKLRRPWGRHLAWFFEGMSEEEVSQLTEWVVSEYMPAHWHADSLELVKRHVAAGDEVVLVSASPAPLLRRIAEQLGVRHVVGTEPAKHAGRYTGGISGEVCIGEAKAKMACAYLEKQGIKVDLADSFAYADSPGDTPMLEMVGHPTATYADADLLPIAKERGWAIFPG